MNIWIHSTIAATSLVAAIAVAAFALTLRDPAPAPVAAKGDRLPIAVESPNGRYVTVEMRGEGLSVLERIPVTVTASN